MKQGDVCKAKADVLIVGHLQDGGKRLGGALAAVDVALEGEIKAAIDAEEFTGLFGTTLHVRSVGRLGVRHVIVVGEGARKELTIERVRQAFATGVKAAVALKTSSVVCVAIGSGRGGQGAYDIVQAITEATLLTSYTFHTWKKEKPHKTRLKRCTIWEINGAAMRKSEGAIGRGLTYAKAAVLARDLVNETPSEMSPEELKHVAERIAAENKRIKLRVLNRTQAEKEGMRAFLAVAAGSQKEPYVVHMHYTPKTKAKKSIALVGKAITFDSGGLSLKPAEAMMIMKCDMAGAAAVLGVFSALVDLEPIIELHGIFAACENMPSGSAYRPGDIIRSRSGHGIEILNTDAEGRVTLADALSYASDLKPDMMIDLATLTGACMIALGEEITGLMTDHDALAAKLLKSAHEAGEPMWRLPLYANYEKLMDSPVADIRNITASRWAGALTAGLFLKKFVDKSIPWAHLDIAGPAYAEREYTPYIPYGGTGAGVRTLLHFIQSIR